MPAPLSQQGSVTFAAIIASSGMTARVRALSSDIADALGTVESLNWAEDLANLGIAIPENENERESVLRSLGSSFGAVATEVSTDGKRGATVRYLPDTGEVVVTFRKVKTRDHK